MLESVACSKSLHSVESASEGHLASPQGQLSHGLNQNVAFDTDVSKYMSLEERERLEWQRMLESVLDGDVFRSEKSRIQGSMDYSLEGTNIRHYNLWLGLRAKLRSRSEDEERRRLEARRGRIVNVVLAEVMKFCVDRRGSAQPPLHQVRSMLHRLDVVQSLYPNSKTFGMENPVVLERQFQIRCDSLNAWFTTQTALHQQIALLCQWTGSSAVEFADTPHSKERLSQDSSRLGSGYLSHMTHSNLAERILRSESIQRTFEKGLIVTVYRFLESARATQIEYGTVFKDLNLPSFENDLVELFRFPTQLAQACLRVRLDYAEKVKDPDSLIVDQLLEDFKVMIRLACTLKRQDEALHLPRSDGNWNPPKCIDDDYDTVILNSLVFFFQLINWKLKGISKDILFKETDILEAHWTTFNDVSLTVNGGAAVVAEQIWSVTVSPFR